MVSRAVIFGGSFNPPGLHHRQLAAELTRHFDRVIVVPCGPRLDKNLTSTVEPVHRAALVDMGFRRLDGVEVELFDLEQESFTRTIMLEDSFPDHGELWHVVGSDLLQGGRDGASVIQSQWYRGQEVWENLNFVVFRRDGFEIDHRDLPPHHLLMEATYPGASAEIRERLFRHQPIGHLVTPEVESYLLRHNLYRGALPLRVTRFELPDPHPLVMVDSGSAEARDLAQRLFPTPPENQPDCVFAIGGDGTILRAIRQHWRLRLPVIGINVGHRGFLLNDPEHVLVQDRPRQDYILQHQPLLYVEMEDPLGEHHTSLAFNDAWVERASAQTAWIEVKVDEEVRLPRLVADGVLVATASGSTAYARAMGATPLRVDTPELLLVGSNVLEPPSWKTVHLSLDSVVTFRTLDADKRPLRGYADGVDQGPILWMRIRKSRIAAVELGFSPDRDLTAKLTEIQFCQ